MLQNDLIFVINLRFVFILPIELCVYDDYFMNSISYFFFRTFSCAFRCIVKWREEKKPKPVVQFRFRCYRQQIESLCSKKLEQLFLKTFQGLLRRITYSISNGWVFLNAFFWIFPGCDELVPSKYLIFLYFFFPEIQIKRFADVCIVDLTIRAID